MIRWHLKHIIEQRGISGKELAKKLEVHPNTVSRLRNTKDDRMPHIDGELLNSLCENLNCSPLDLIEYIPHGQVTKDIPNKTKHNSNLELMEFNSNLEWSAEITKELVRVVDTLVTDGIPSDKLAKVTVEIMKKVISISRTTSDS